MATVASTPGVIRYAFASAIAALVIAASGCGKSAEDKAKDSFCSARSDLQAHVDNLKGLTLTTATRDGVTKELDAIQSDLRKMSAAQGDLDKSRKQQAAQARQEFESQVSSTLSTLGTSTSLSQAATQLKAAFQELASSFEQTYAKVDC